MYPVTKVCALCTSVSLIMSLEFGHTLLNFIPVLLFLLRNLFLHILITQRLQPIRNRESKIQAPLKNSFVVVSSVIISFVHDLLFWVELLNFMVTYCEPSTCLSLLTKKIN